jgi:hypothetical protein
MHRARGNHTDATVSNSKNDVQKSPRWRFPENAKPRFIDNGLDLRAKRKNVLVAEDLLRFSRFHIVFLARLGCIANVPLKLEGLLPKQPLDQPTAKLELSHHDLRQ